MISRVTASASLLLGLVCAVIMWRVADSPDSDLWSGLLAASPLLALAVFLGFIAHAVRRESPAPE